MPYEHKPNSGTIFENDRKTKETHPDLKGSALIAGKDYWVSVWINDKPGQKRRMSMAFEEKLPAATTTSTQPSKWPAKQLPHLDESRTVLPEDESQEAPF